MTADEWKYKATLTKLLRLYPQTSCCLFASFLPRICIFLSTCSMYRCDAFLDINTSFLLDCFSSRELAELSAIPECHLTFFGYLKNTKSSVCSCQEEAVSTLSTGSVYYCSSTRDGWGVCEWDRLWKHLVTSCYSGIKIPSVWRHKGIRTRVCISCLVCLI